MEKKLVIFILSCMALSLTACKKGVPNVADLKSLSGFSVDQTSAPISSKVTPAFVLTGQCSAKFSEVQVSTDGGTTWTSASKVASSSSVNCLSTGRFSISLAFTSGYFDSTKWTAGGAYNSFYVRGYSSFGFSTPISVQLTNSVAKVGQITAGGGKMTGGAYSLSGEISGLSESQLSGGAYKLNGEVVW